MRQESGRSLASAWPLTYSSWHLSFDVEGPAHGPAGKAGRVPAFG